jgi:hypothetical protein
LVLSIDYSETPTSRSSTIEAIVFDREDDRYCLDILLRQAAQHRQLDEKNGKN